MTMDEESHVSAGGVVYRQIEHRIEVALIRVAWRGHEDRWQLPKGTLDEGETAPVAALREVHEETGLTAEIVEDLKKIDYWFSFVQRGRRTRTHKFVHFYLMRWLSGVVEDHDHEVEEARWFEIDHAIQALTYESERDVLQEARDYIEKFNAG